MLWPTCRLREAVPDISMRRGDPLRHTEKGAAVATAGNRRRSDPKVVLSRPVARSTGPLSHPRSPDLEGTALPVAGNE
jgi:hypothetical protein